MGMWGLMKKHLKTFGKILLLLIIYYVMQILCAIPIMVNVVMKELKDGNMDKTYINNFVYSNMMYALIPAIIISLFIYFLMYRKNAKNLIARCNFKMISFAEVMNIIVIITGASMVIGGISYYFSKYFPSYEQTSQSIQAGEQTLLGIIVVVILAPIFEEILFRGIILSEIRENLNIILAVVLQGVAFGIYHMNLFQGLYAGVLGIILGFICVRVNSLTGSIVGHITFNLTGSLLIPLAIYYSQNYAYLYIGFGIIILIISLIKFYYSTKEKIFCQEV